MNIRIAVILIATGKRYFDFAVRLAPQVQELFTKHQKYIFLMTNADYSEVPGVDEVVFIEHLPAPLPTLLRFHRIHQLRGRLANFTHVYYLDVDMEIVQPIGDEILAPLVAVRHWVWPLRELTSRACFETRSNLRAYVNPTEATVYVQASVQGGERETYLAAVQELRDDVNFDLDHGSGEHGLIAVWHDESYWNRWVNAHIDEFRILPPEYAGGDPAYAAAPQVLVEPVIEFVKKDRDAAWAWSDDEQVEFPSLISRAVERKSVSGNGPTSGIRLYYEAFAVLGTDLEFSLLMASLDGIWSTHQDRLRVFVFLDGKFRHSSVQAIDAHPLRVAITLIPTFNLPCGSGSLPEIKTGILEFLVGRAVNVCLLHSGDVLLEPFSRQFHAAAHGVVVWSPVDRPARPDITHEQPGDDAIDLLLDQLASGSVCINLSRHWEAVAAWAFAARFRARLHVAGTQGLPP